MGFVLAALMNWWERFWQVSQGGEDERVRTFLLAVVSLGTFVVLVRVALQFYLYRPVKAVLSGQLAHLGEQKVSPEKLYPLMFQVYGARKKSERERAQDDAQLPAMAAAYSHRLPASHAWLSEELLKKGRSPAELRGWLDQAIDVVEDLGLDQDRQALKTLRKVTWLAYVLSAFLLLFVTVLGNPGPALMGAAGGLISRLLRFFRGRGSAQDDNFDWQFLILTPLVGALSGLAGVLLVDIAGNWGLMGSAVSGVVWSAPSMNPATALVALLFGFSERLLDHAVKVVQTKFGESFDESKEQAGSGGAQEKVRPPGATSVAVETAVDPDLVALPIKATSAFGGIFHEPGCSYYDATVADARFATAEAAEAAGYRHGVDN